MGYSPEDRKTALSQINLGHPEIAKACGVERSLVSHVIAGRRWMGKGARQIMAFISLKLDKPILELFPESTRKKGQGKVKRAA